MISAKPADKLVHALVRLAHCKRARRNHDRRNAIALLLTNLPKRHQAQFYALVEESFAWPELVDSEPAYVFSSYDVGRYVMIRTKNLSNKIIHSILL